MKLTGLKTNYLGTHSTYFSSIDSTQKEIWRRIEANTANNGELVFANIQTSGIGTHGRVWHTDEENNIAFSFYIKTDCNLGKMYGVTKQIAVIMQDILRDLYNIEIQIKEPNDLMINNKKLGGILTESKVSGNVLKYLVIGIGINTYKTKFTDDIKDIATSIKKEYGIDADNEMIIAEFCNRFEAYIDRVI